MPHDSPGFSDRLNAAIERIGSPACVGLDPVLERLPSAVAASCHDPVAAIDAFCRGIVDAVTGIVPAVKFQSACFERYGSPGFASLEGLMHRARARGHIVILDAKRGDIGVTAEHYAHACLRAGADAVTVNGYLGPATIEPFLASRLGVFVLVRTSNPDSDAVQSHRLADGRSIAEMMADTVASLGSRYLGASGSSDVGAVVGATKAADALALRARMPHQIFLVPGYGAQGGTADDVRAMLDDRGRGVLVNASRSVIYGFDANGSWLESVRGSAEAFAKELAGVRRAGEREPRLRHRDPPSS